MRRKIYYIVTTQTDLQSIINYVCQGNDPQQVFIDNFPSVSDSAITNACNNAPMPIVFNSDINGFNLN